MGIVHTYIEASGLPQGAHLVKLPGGVALAPRVVVAPELPIGALRVTIGSVTLVPDTRLVRPTNRRP